ncbi:hypothetical protein Tsubulata_035826 [Turnera subulata]|uniref:Uncharacterized protein n=1 Tax=Turnera subulata TaxID=218843 RepID=A0A9Q0JEB5_9ROSI|nr:hypothetical protein Tsubulata_035826 [Turnera subulata]
MGRQQETSAVAYNMTGGDGPDSYYRNSIFQRTVVEDAMKAVKKDIEERLQFPIENIPKTFRVADFGCCVGPNTFVAMQSIIEAVGLKYDDKSEFEVLFNDHANNDFNTLFRNLPSAFPFSSQETIFCAGVPGDFHARVLPRASLHLGYSSYALQWLSKNPDQVADPNSPAWNKDSIYCDGHSPQVVKAYSAQFQSDLQNFLNARAQEIVGGGLLIFTIPGVPHGALCSQNYHGLFYGTLGSCLQDMVKEGLISQEKVEAFNIPMYYPPIQELEAFLQGNADFSLERIYAIPSETLENVHSRANMEPTVASVASLVSAIVRAIMEVVIKQHIGEDIVEPVFERFSVKFSQNYHKLAEMQTPTNISVVLKRKH